MKFGGLGVEGLRFRDLDLGFRDEVWGFRVEGLGFWGLGLEDKECRCLLV